MKIAMKHKPILFAIALLFVVGAALWGVNYRLDHPPIPPLTASDKEFQERIEGANKVYASQWSCQTMGCFGGEEIKYPALNQEQTQQFVDCLRFADEKVPTQFLGVGSTQIQLEFWRNGQRVETYTIWEKPTRDVHSIAVVKGHPNPRYYLLAPRFVRPLNRALDAYLPQRIRP